MLYHVQYGYYTQQACLWPYTSILNNSASAATMVIGVILADKYAINTLLVLVVNSIHVYICIVVPYVARNKFAIVISHYGPFKKKSIHYSSTL